MERHMENEVRNHLENHKILVLLGPKNVGKKELVEKCIPSDSVVLHLDANQKKIRKSFENPSEENLKQLIGDARYVIIDDAQYLVKLQTIIEEILFQSYSINLILNCSFEPILDEVLREVLQMQGLELTLYPYLFQELANQQGIVEFDKKITERLLYGNYPQVIENPTHAPQFLMELVEEAIFTHLSPKERINKADKLLKMLQALAFQIGEPISYNDIAFKAGLDNETVERYIHLLERAYILIRIPSFFNGNRYELKKTHCIYFVDNGIRNAIIRNFNEIELRNDVDVLWKNWLISERIKWNKLQKNESTYAFWRTHTKQQMDFIEIQQNTINAYKSIWDKRKKPRFPASFKVFYPHISTHALNRSTYWGFLSKK